MSCGLNQMTAATSLGTLQFRSFSLLPSKWDLKQTKFSATLLMLKRDRNFHFRVLNSDSLDSSKPQSNDYEEVAHKVLGFAFNRFSRLHYSISTLPPVLFLTKRRGWSNFVASVLLATAVLVVAIRAYLVKKSRNTRRGSVADLVRRGQLHSHRRGISSPLKYEDPFDNPLVKVRKENSTLEMCGKVYRLAPVTLTEEQQATHQIRRSRAYQWKRPTVFLKEGELIPPDVDPDTVRWIPANHPFATTASEIDEDLAQNNVHQQHGVPFRIRAEHEALQRKLETLQQEQKLNNLHVDSANAKEFERPFKKQPKMNELNEQTPLNYQADESSQKSDSSQHSFGHSLSEDTQKY